MEQEALKRLENSRVQAAEDEAATEAATDNLQRNNSPLVCLGEPGTGKTFVADYLIRLARQRGLRVLYALPTGQLACRMRTRHPNIEVDTCAGAFLFHRPLPEALPLLTQYDVVVVDEVLQLSAEEFGRLHEMYMAAGKQLLLLLMGDEWQLPSIHPERASDHPRWRFGHFVTFDGGPPLSLSNACGQAGGLALPQADRCGGPAPGWANLPRP
ncbi:MAG: AAA family ATPase [Alphaproteobacteria bacterium]|nr:AAA family ATPase [Alphaproteobacteria bacterium]